MEFLRYTLTIYQSANKNPACAGFLKVNYTRFFIVFFAAFFAPFFAAFFFATIFFIILTHMCEHLVNPCAQMYTNYFIYNNLRPMARRLIRMLIMFDYWINRVQKLFLIHCVLIYYYYRAYKNQMQYFFARYLWITFSILRNRVA